MAFTLMLDRPLIERGSTVSKYFLQTAIVLLGFKLNMADLWQISATYTLTVAVYVGSALGLGLLIGFALKVEKNSSLLMASGTAICGGTAIVTLSPILRARADQMGAALAIVFLLNALALLAFPYIGHWLSMSQEQFGVWVALAIHDTSSVVATAQIYGEEATTIATTVKLGRTLWLIPMVLVTSFWVHAPKARMRVPTFILFFILASVSGSLVPLPEMWTASVTWLSKALLVVALFLVGTEISRNALKNVLGKVLGQALILWLLVIATTLTAVLQWVS